MYLSCQVPKDRTTIDETQMASTQKYEQYCFDECHSAGGNSALAGMEHGGPCAICRRHVDSFAGMVVPHQRRVAIICSSCREKGMQWIAKMMDCSWCGKEM